MKIAATYEKETGEVIDNGGNGHHALPPYNHHFSH